jgi:cytochrome P450
MRRLLSHAFSERALRGQEDLVRKYVDLLISQLPRRSTKYPSDNGEGIVDIMSWYNYATFDIIGDLAFGEPFGCLRDGIWHRWMRSIYSTVKGAALFRAARRFPRPVKEILDGFLPAKLAEDRKYQFEFSAERAKNRLMRGSEREDFSKFSIDLARNEATYSPLAVFPILFLVNLHLFLRSSWS